MQTTPTASRPLADLHQHLYGCLRATTLLARLLRFEPHLPLQRYEEAFGHGPPLRAVKTGTAQ